uniref:ATP binding protein n=1 Tax=Solanum tuberosum TaxID=4113 RepID=M1ANG4_SOLTU
MNTFINNNNKFNKKKVVFIKGATGTGKFRLSVDHATHFRGEIINSDKMEVYKGLDIVTNKITHAKKQGVQHYLVGEIEPDSDLTAEDFCLKSIVYIENILKTQCVPIIVGGSNSYIQNFVEDPVFMFKYKYDSCFNWIDVEQSVLNRRVDTRVDEMVNATKMNTFINNNNKFNKQEVVFIMGATGTGKSRLSVDHAIHFRGEIINSDKIQVYKGLDIMTNKITHAEKQGVRQYLLAKMNTFINNNNKFNKKKVVFIMGATETGKSRLSVDLGTHFRGEIINSDKMQVYKGLDIVTNKITHTEKQGVRHYLLGEIEPDSDFTAEDFCLKSIV